MLPNRDCLVHLYGETEYFKDADGNETAKEKKTTVYGQQRSVYSTEFFNAGKLGIKPSCMVIVYTAEYSGEKYLSIDDGQRLSVYRTYVLGEKIELYCTERTGEQ